MTSQPAVLDLLEQYMDSRGGGERWLTVQEFRHHFRLQKNSSKKVSGILHRIYKNPVFASSCRVIRIERIRDPGQPSRMVMKYLVRRNGAGRDGRTVTPR